MQSHSLVRWVAVGLVAWGAASAGAAAPVRSYSFDNDAQGWVAQDGGELVHVRSKGRHGGYLKVTDVSSADFLLVAPSEALGDWSRFLGGELRFQARNGNSDAPDWAPFGEVTLSDGVQTLTLDGVPPGEPVADLRWRPYVIPLTEATWGPALPELLKNIQSLKIKLEFHNGVSEVIHFDNYRLRRARPE